MRRICTSPYHRGSRWLLANYFHAKGWNSDKTAPIRVQSRCMACMRIEQRIKKGVKKNGVPYQAAQLDGSRRYYSRKLYKLDKNKRRRRRYKDYRDPRLPIEPFQLWLYTRVMENSISGVASNAGVSQKRVSTLLAGTYKKNDQTYQMKHIRFSTIERFMSSFSDPVTLIYDPELIENYRATYYDGRMKLYRSA